MTEKISKRVHMLMTIVMKLARKSFKKIKKIIFQEIP